MFEDEDEDEVDELRDEAEPESFIDPLLGDAHRPEYVQTLGKLTIGASIIHALTGWRPPGPPKPPGC